MRSKGNEVSVNLAEESREEKMRMRRGREGLKHRIDSFTSLPFL